MSDLKTDGKRQVGARVDQIVIDALNDLAERDDVSASRYVERLLIEHLKAEGVLPEDYRAVRGKRVGGRKCSTIAPSNCQLAA